MSWGSIKSGFGLSRVVSFLSRVDWVYRESWGFYLESIVLYLESGGFYQE
ncbi:hypothetical protein GCM10008924_05280 [Gracilibacillus halotolerans]